MSPQLRLGRISSLFVLAVGCGGDPSQPTTEGGDASTGAGATTDEPTTGAPTTTTSASTTGETTVEPFGTSGTTGDEIDPYLESEPLFALGKIAEFELTLSDGALLALDAEPKNYTQGDLVATIDGQTYTLPGIGVRLKGNYGSFRTLDEKAAFLLDFDRYVDDQRLLGLEKLAVNNMVQDCSMQREILGYALFRDLGVAAPRAGYVTVRVNGELYGLYTAVEAVDNSPFLDHWFGDDDGSLYEGAYGSDVEIDLVPSFDQDNGDDIGLADLFAFAAALDGMTDPEAFPGDVDAVLALDEFLAFAATEIYLGHWDGYAWTRNNFSIYRRPDLRWQFLPWGIDQTLRDHMDPFGGDGRLQQMCAGSPTCRPQLAAAFEQVVAGVAALDLAGRAAELGELIAADVLADPRKECSPEDNEGSIAANIDFLGSRADSIASGLLCTDPGAVDDDGDGYSACLDDCNDGDPNVNPGATEVCDLDDDNCNGVWDDAPNCPKCATKDLPGPGTAAFCFVARTYLEAEADCLAQGGKMLSIHSQTIQDWAAAEAFAIADADWWIGLDDLDQEGAFTWSDGTPLDFTAWNEGEPNNVGDEDCVNLPNWTGGLWNDLPCEELRPYICRMP